ncbi:MAG: ATP-binding cassette domain-containing protein [Cryobacterium sp.]|nr:ATP-binding cassette domain-containing protein [Oligoflexia bacterium]
MIQVTGLTKQYGPRKAIDNLNFDVKRGEIVGFLGPNGAGKSTTMKIITAFTPASEGTVVVNGHDVFEEPIEVKRAIGYLPENPPIYMEMTVSDYLEFAARLNQVPKNLLKRQVDWALQKTNIGDVRGRIIGNLSKGYKQRVGLAQALVHNPAVLVLDEPTVGLDPKQIIEIRELIKSLAGEHTIILSSHILPEVTATCGRIIVINHGKIVAEDTIDGLTLRLKKGLLLQMTVKEAHAEGLAAIRAVPGVLGVAATGPKLVIDLAPNQGEIRDLVARAAVEKGMGILEFGSEKVSLEEIFLQLTTTESDTSLIDPSSKGVTS